MREGGMLGHRAGSSIMRHYHTMSKHRARIDGSRGPKVAFKEVVHPVKPPLGSPDGQIGLSGPFLHPSQFDVGILLGINLVLLLGLLCL
jgi:hypothetical protein